MPVGVPAQAWQQPFPSLPPWGAICLGSKQFLWWAHGHQPQVAAWYPNPLLFPVDLRAPICFLSTQNPADAPGYYGGRPAQRRAEYCSLRNTNLAVQGPGMEGLQVTLLVPQGPGQPIATLYIRVIQGEDVGGPNLILAPTDRNGILVPFT